MQNRSFLVMLKEMRGLLIKTFFFLVLPCLALGEAMSLQQALNRSIKDRVESAEKFQKSYMSTKTDKDLAAQLVDPSEEKKSRSVSSEEEDGFSDESSDIQLDEELGIDLDQ